MTAYMTQEAYADYHFSDVSDTDFPKLLALASDKIDYLTRGYYRLNDLSAETDTIRHDAFLKAIAYQISNMQDTQLYTSNQANNRPASQSQTTGKTTISKSYNSQNSVSSQSRNASVSNEAIAELILAGLFYLGVKRC